MSGSINKVILIGNVGQDPEIRSFQSGGKVCNLSIATSERWRDRESNEQKERTQWHRVVVFNENLVNLIEKYVNKGSKLYIEGQLETRKWTDSSGIDKYATEVVLRNFKGEITFLDSRNNNNENQLESNNNSVNQEENSQLNQSFTENPSIDSDIDDDIPF
ncbi:MAG: single-stranded DNA-binding protein [Pelagibacterales bacterium]|nr:single-stranded DNA-binding protein [Pelagibacterales bacterium]PPR16021.1 MAG: Single-stranded DNA-binding protein [Alphaproteobacteria bacterium MarineAlpha9_Bin3]|tara:strand:+ start:8313 stop:8795 length:483 start_codon:yes stop_codon:yes gene_type:complete